MAKKSSTKMTYKEYMQRNTDPGKGPVSYSTYKQKEEEQRAARQAQEEALARQQRVKDMAARMTVQKARDTMNPIMNNTGMGQAENARNSFGIGKQYTVKDNSQVTAKEAQPQKREYIEWLQKLNKTKQDKEEGIKQEKKAAPIVQRSPEEVKNEFVTQKTNQLRQAYADRALGFEAVEDSRKKNNTGNQWTLGQQFDIDADRRKYQAEDMYGDSGLPFYMNNDQRKALRDESVSKAQELRDKAKLYEEYDQDAALGEIYDLMYNRDTANERAILDNPAYKGTDFERNAQATLAGLENQYAAQRRYSQDNARRLLEEGINLNAETPYEKEKLREQVYDRVMGDNYYKDGTLDTYKERIKGLSYEEKKALDDELDRAISNMASPWGEGDQASAVESLNREASAWDAQVKAIDAAQTYYDFIDRQRKLAGSDVINKPSSYDPSLHPEAKMVQKDVYGLVPEPQGTDVDKAYYWANNWQNLGDYANDLLNVNKYMFIAADPEILEMFNKFYAKDKENQLDRLHGLTGTNFAQQFLDGLDPYLTSMLVEYQNNFIQSKAQNPAIGAYMRIMSPAIQTVGGVTGTLAAMTGQDIDSQLYLPTRMVAQTRSRQNEDIGKLAEQAFGEFGGDATRFMLGVVDSVADNVFAMGVGAGFGGEGTKAAMRFVQLIMSGSATSNKMVEMLENGVQPTEAALYAVGDGVIEWLTERYSLEEIMGPDVRQMFGNKKAIASFIGRSAAAEGSEEINSGLLNMGLDYILSMIYGHENELKQKYNELVTVGGMSDAKASRKVIEDKLRELGTEGLAGAISGMAMAGSRYIGVTNESRQQGKKIKGTKSGTDVMLDLARGMAEGSDSRTLADQLTAEIEKGNEVSNYDLGRLANLTLLDVGEARGQAIKDAVMQNVTKQLTDSGIAAEAAKQYAEIIGRQIFEGGKLTKAEISTLGQDERAINLWKDFNTMSAASINLARAVNAGTKTLDSVAQKVSELVTGGVKANSAAAAEIEKSLSETNSMEEAIDNLQARRSGLLSEEYAKLAKDYLKENPEAKKNKAYLDDVMKIRLAAMTMDSLPETGLDSEAAQKLYDAAKQEFDQIDEERIKNQRPAEEGQGVTTYKGAEYGTAAWKAATEGLSKATKNVMGAVGEIAARFGYRVNMVNDPENPDVYGFEDADTGAITINVANGFKHHMLVTMAHEMTHWLEQNSRGGYDDLRSFVLQSLRNEGVNIQERIVQIMDNYNMVMGEKAGSGLTINGAMLELVAQSSEGLLSSRRAAQELQNINPGLYSKVKSFVQNVVARINAAIKGTNYDSSLSKEAKALEKYRDQLADIWFDGRKNAMPGEPTEEQEPAAETQAAEGQKDIHYSVANELDQEYEEAVNSGDWAKAEKMLMDKYEQMESQGLIGYNSSYFFNGDHAVIARAIKNGNAEVVRQAAEEMAAKVPDNAVLIPMPPHSGKVTNNTDTMILARAISKITGRPVVVALESAEHMSRNQAKKEGVRVTAGDMGFRQIQSIPENAMPVFIDNVVGGGVTAKAAHDAIGRGITLAYAQSSRSKIKGAKYLSVTRQDGKLIPLSERMNPQNNDWRYSLAQRDQAYMQAVESGNTEEQQRLVDQAAEEAGYTEKAYHGTMKFGFTVFDMAASQDQIFVAYDKDISKTYSNDEDVRRIDKKREKPNFDKMTGEELRDYYYDTYKDSLNNDKNNIVYINKNETKEYKENMKKEYLDMISKEKWPEHYHTYNDLIKTMQFTYGYNADLIKGHDFSSPYEAAKYVIDQYENHYESKYQLAYRDTMMMLATRYGDYNVQGLNPAEVMRKNEGLAESLYKTLKLTDNNDFIGLYAFGGKTVSYFTLNEIRNYLKNHVNNQGTYELYTKPGKQLVVDAKGKLWKFIPFNERNALESIDENGVYEYVLEDYEKEKLDMLGLDYPVANTRKVARWAYNNGYDSVRIKNVIDNGGRGTSNAFGDIGIFFKQSDVKSADPVTYDDNGDVIPPSERFNEEQKDIRYSIAEGPDMDVDTFMLGLNEFNLPTYQEKTMLRQYKSHKNTIKLLEEKIRTREKERDELMARGRLDPATQAKIDELNDAVQKAKAATKAKQRTLIDENNKLIQEKWAIQKKGRQLTNDEKARLKEINQQIQANNDEVNGSSYDLSQLIRNTEEQKKAMRGDARMNFADSMKLSKINSWLNSDRRKLNRMQEELVRITGEKGYARMMKNQRTLMENLVSGRTAEDLEDTVNAMQESLDTVTKEMEERADNLKKLASAEAVLKIRQMFDNRGLKRIAAKLKADVNSELENSEIENRLALIALKMKQGKYDAENAEELADMLAGRIKREMTGYYIPALRGSTIVLGDVQMKELKGTHRTLADIRAQLAGTGIRISDKGGVTLDSKWEDLCREFPSLDPEENVGNQLDALLEKILDEKNQQETVYNNEDLMKINTKLLEAAQELIPEIITDENSLRLIRESMAFVARVSGAAKSNAEALEDINNLIRNMQKKGESAVRTAKKLTGDVGETIEYFDQLSLQSEAAMWKEERMALIDQLKSENTKNLMEEAARWRERIEKDKSYRELAGENLQTRKRITTNVSRVRKLLINETDLKNIPEHMKGLAREMLTKIVDNDLGMRKLTGIDKKDLEETRRVLGEMRKLDGDFMPDDLKLMADEEAQAAVFEAMADLEEGLQEYNSQRTGDMMTKAQAVKATLDKISDAVSTITSVINAERTVSYLDRVVPIGYAAGKIQADMKNSRFKGEWQGTGSKAVEAVKRSVYFGNMTPEYFIKYLRNRGMNELWEDAQEGENRNGLEVQKAQQRLAKLAEETGYKAWANEKHDVTLGGQKRTITIGNMMELYAIWKREKTSNPEMSQHLNKGGVFFQEEEKGGKLHRETTDQRAIRVTDEEILAMYDSMTENQKKLIEGVVSYLSNDMSRLGNEASMRMYGIRKYKELYYFPMKVWDGVKSARSDKGITGSDENRMAHKSWSKRRQHMAKNALVIGDFMTDAVNHIVEMINYNTMAPAIENINKVLNYKFTEEAGTDNETQRNLRVLFQQAYGRDALNYLETLMKDMNGGVTQDQRRTLRDRALTMFKKNAVAGSLSVALQQPLSYIRASMMISPKYLAPAPVTNNWKDSYKEMMQYSGVAVIKRMGRFDMNFGQSAKDYITPDTKQSLYNRATDALTAAPEYMDAMTWTWMWAAVKAETADKNPGMDKKSEAFMRQTAKRFNEVMRKTQVYDSVLVKSSNMRSNNLGMKVITSFMAEPTLSLNVLTDAIRNAGTEGGKKHLAKALSTFFLSAIFQAGVKGLMGSGRTPDKKKTWFENFLNKFQYNLINEGNMISLIPGYSDLIEVLKTGELQDDAMGAIGKLSSIVDTLRKAAQGNGKGAWRDVEDTVGQFAQLFTNIPAKNLMRDARAIYNWIAGSEYADRPTSGAVIRYQTEANFFNADNLLGTINAWLGEAGFVSTNSRYYSRIYNAMKNGDKGTEKGIKEYLTLAKGVKDDTINTGIKNAAKKDNSMTDAEKDAWMIKNNLMGENNVSTITTQYKEGKITAAEAKKLWKELDPKLTEKDLYWKLDRADYQKETGADSVSGYSYRLHDAIAENKGDSIRKAIKDMLDHGVKKESIKSAITEKWKEIYLNADSKTRTKIRDAIQKAYKAIGLTANDANKVIDNWKKK